MWQRKVLGNLQLHCHQTGNEGEPVEHVPHALFVETLDANDDKQSNQLTPLLMHTRGKH